MYVWRWTIDVFATQSNAMAARFMSLTDESNSAHVGVLSLGSWNQLECARGEYGMGSRKYMPLNRCKQANKDLQQQGVVRQLRGILN